MRITLPYFGVKLMQGSVMELKERISKFWQEANPSWQEYEICEELNQIKQQATELFTIKAFEQYIDFMLEVRDQQVKGVLKFDFNTLKFHHIYDVLKVWQSVLSNADVTLEQDKKLFDLIEDVSSLHYTAEGFEIASALIALGHFQRAILYLEKLFDTYSVRTGGYVELLKCYCELGEFAKAEKIAIEHLDYSANNINGIRYLQYLIEIDQIKMAERFLDADIAFTLQCVQFTDYPHIKKLMSFAHQCVLNNPEKIAFYQQLRASLNAQAIS